MNTEATTTPNETEPAIQANIRGLKCDRPGCGYVDMTVKVEEYSNYVDRPCPKCGASLLTKADMRTVRFLLFLVRLFNLFVRPVKPTAKTKRVTVRGEMNGTGSIRFKPNG